MTNIFKESAGPYLLALMIGGLGWLTTTSISELKSLHLVEYRVAPLHENGGDFFAVDIANVSYALPAKNLTISIQCPQEDQDCIKGDSKIGERLNWQYSRGDNLIMAPIINIGGSAPSIYQLSVSLPARAEVNYKIPAADKAKELRLTYVLPDNGESELIFRKSPSLESFLLRNYLWTLLACFSSLLALVLVWILVAFAGAFRNLAQTGAENKSAGSQIDNAP